MLVYHPAAPLLSPNHLLSHAPQASTSVRGLLVHLKSTSRDGGLVSHLVEGLTLLYEEAQEQHGDEEPTLAAGAAGWLCGWLGAVWCGVLCIEEGLQGACKGSAGLWKLMCLDTLLSCLRLPSLTHSLMYSPPFFLRRPIRPPPG